MWHENENEIVSENISQSKTCEYCICRVLFDVTSSPFLQTSTINKHIKTYNNEDPTFLRSLHVDDLNIGSENTHDCYNFYNKAMARLDQASFNLRKLKLNSFDLEYLSNGEINRNSIVTKVLGLMWEKQKDNFTFSFKNLVALIYPCPTKNNF